MNSREDGQRRIRTATVGLAAASLIGTAALTVTVAVQGSAGATTDSTDSGTTDQGGSGFTPPDGGLTNGGTNNGGTNNSGTGGDFVQPDTGNTGTLPHARSGGSR
jgi:hypothetical protein